jgi:hypothetical protein
MKLSIPYNGYLAAYVELIRALHEGGASTWEIAKALYAAGARARSSDPHSGRLSRKQHLVNLRAMTIHIQRRLGLRMRHVRVMNLKAIEVKRPAGGGWLGAKSVDDDATMKEKSPCGAQNH